MQRMLGHDEQWRQNECHFWGPASLASLEPASPQRSVSKTSTTLRRDEGALLKNNWGRTKFSLWWLLLMHRGRGGGGGEVAEDKKGQENPELLTLDD